MPSRKTSDRPSVLVAPLQMYNLAILNSVLRDNPDLIWWVYLNAKNDMNVVFTLLSCQKRLKNKLSTSFR